MIVEGSLPATPDGSAHEHRARRVLSDVKRHQQKSALKLVGYLVAAYLVLLGAHARGLAGYWRTVPLLDDPRGRAILELPDGETPVGLLYLGSPVQEQRVPERAPIGDVVTYLR